MQQQSQQKDIDRKDMENRIQQSRQKVDETMAPIDSILDRIMQGLGVASSAKGLRDSRRGGGSGSLPITRPTRPGNERVRSGARNRLP